MDRIKLHIQKLGKIRDAEIEISPLTIFCGNSGLGKSYLAMLVHYFYAILWDKSFRFANFFKTSNRDYSKMVASFRGEGEAFRFSKASLEQWLAEDSIAYLRYLLKNELLDGKISVSLPNSVPAEFIFHYKEELTGLVNKDDVYLLLQTNHLTYRVGNKSENNITDEQRSPFAFLLGAELVYSLFGDIKNFTRAFCLPPSRGPVMTEDVRGRSGLYSEFIEQKRVLEKASEQQEIVSKELLSLMSNVLDGDVRQEENGDYSYITHDAQIPLSAAAASIREIAPLALIAKRNDIKTISILFEEPEAHLHPLKQRMIADIVSAFVSGGASMQITTHSDYFLRRINELILLKKLRDKDERKFSEVCKQEKINPLTALDCLKISAYYLSEKENRDVVVEKQNLEDGIPFTAFQEAIKKSFKCQDMLEELLLDE